MSENDAPDERRSDQRVAAMSRRQLLAALGAGGAGSVAGCGGGSDDRETNTPTATETRAAGEAAPAEWTSDVDAQGHALRDLGSLSTRETDAPIRDVAGAHLSVDDEGALNAHGVPDSTHYVTDYPGETLDAKIRTIIDEIVENYGHQAGHRIVVPPAPADDPASTGGAAWRFEDPVVIANNTGKLQFEFGRTLVFATAEIESFFVIGPDEKTEEVNFHGGYFYASGSHDDPNVTRSFFQIPGIGHMDVQDVYCQNLAPNVETAGKRDESKNVPMGFEITAKQGTSGVFVGGCSVTGCDEALRAEGVNGLTVESFTGGGGDSTIVFDGCSMSQALNVDVGAASIQSIKRDIVRLENGTGPNQNVRIEGVSETNANYEYHAAVNAVDSAGAGKHRGVLVSDVAVAHAEYSTDMSWAVDFDQRALTPAPAYPAANGATRAYSEGVQTFAAKFAHEFRVGGASAVSLGEDVTVAGAGNGTVLTTPDGQNHYRVRVDNDGNLVTEAVQQEADRSGVVDSFEDGDLAEYFGETGQYAVTTDPPVSDGDYSVKNTTGDTAIFGSTEGLPRYPRAGDTFSAAAARTETTPNLGVAFGMQDTNNFYFARIYPEGTESEENSDRLQLYKRVDGEYTPLAKSVADVVTGTLYEFVVDWGKTGEISVSVRDPDGDEVASASTTDTTFTEGGVGARQTGVLDEIRIL